MFDSELGKRIQQMNALIDEQEDLGEGVIKNLQFIRSKSKVIHDLPSKLSKI